MWELHRILTLQGWLPFISLIYIYVFFFSAPTLPLLWAQKANSRATQEQGPVALVLLQTSASSPASTGACCFKIRLLCGMLSALIHYPGRASNQLECKICFSGVARRLCQHCRVYVLAHQLMFFGQDSSVLLSGDHWEKYFLCWTLLLHAKLMAYVPRDRFRASGGAFSLLGHLGLYQVNVLWLHVQVSRDLLSLFITPDYLLHVHVIIFDTWYRWRPDVVASLAPCWAAYSLTHILSLPVLTIHSKKWSQSKQLGPRMRLLGTQCLLGGEVVLSGSHAHRKSLLGKHSLAPFSHSPLSPPFGDTALYAAVWDSADCQRNLQAKSLRGVRENPIEKVEQQFLGA